MPRDGYLSGIYEFPGNTGDGFAMAYHAGAEMVITACPLCMYNLDANATEHRLPVKYFTELLAEALGVKE